MYRAIKNQLKRNKKVQDEYATSIRHGYDGYHCSLSRFLEELRKSERNKDSVIFRETIGWEPRVRLSWDKPRSFSPQEAADYIERRNLLSDHWNYFESRWQIFSGREQIQHYFDIDFYHTTFPLGSMQIEEMTHKIIIDYLLTKMAEENRLQKPTSK